MKPVGLTGLPEAQDAVGVLLATVATRRGLNLKLFVGLKASVEAYHLHEVGGEVWHCGPYAPDRAMVGYIDRVLPGTQAAELEPQVTASLDAMLAKTPINGETNHG
jgi:hypothetical protein